MFLTLIQTQLKNVNVNDKHVNEPSSPKSTSDVATATVGASVSDASTGTNTASVSDASTGTNAASVSDASTATVDTQA